VWNPFNIFVDLEDRIMEIDPSHHIIYGF
jgi:hypothetical protein